MNFKILQTIVFESKQNIRKSVNKFKNNITQKEVGLRKIGKDIMQVSFHCGKRLGQLLFRNKRKASIGCIPQFNNTINANQILILCSLSK